MKKAVFFFLSLYGLTNLVNAQYPIRIDSDKNYGALLSGAIRPGKYFIKTALADKYLDAKDGNPAAGTALQLWDLHSMWGEVWEVIPSGETDYFYIKSEMGRYLEVLSGSAAPGARVQIADFNGVGNAQKWKFLPVTGGYNIQSKLGTYLEVKDARTVNGNPVWLWSRQKAPELSKAQVWKCESAGEGNPLAGFVDMHTHPMARWGFGTQLFAGEIEGNPADALGSCSCKHNFVPMPLDGSCSEQNIYRNSIVDNIDYKYYAPGTPVHRKVAAYPDFNEWPKHNSILHQQMYVDWIKRAYEGGLRVMVSLTVNSHCLADAAETSTANDDKSSMDLQLTKILEFVSHHHDFMEIAYSASDLKRIVRSNKLAVIMGVEMDNIGNFYRPADPKGASYIPNPTEADVSREIDRLYEKGVRYIFPIHLTNNAFGGTAVYKNTLNVANKYNTGRIWEVEPVDAVSSGITFKLMSSYEAIDELGVFAMNFSGTFLPGHIMPNNRDNYPVYPDPGLRNGHRNTMGLTPVGAFAVKYMMRKGMIIDIDHASDKAITDVPGVNSILGFANAFTYPVNSGHNGPRGDNGNENDRTELQYRTIARLGGMIGVGHGGNAETFLRAFRTISRFTGGKQLAIGTDANGLEPLPGPPQPAARIVYNSSLTKYTMGTKQWDFNESGMAHYGLLPDYIQSWTSVGMTGREKDTFFKSAEYFAQMWEKCERAKFNVR